MRFRVTLVMLLSLICLPVFGQSPRVFVTDSQSWEVNGKAGGARGQTAELIKTFTEKCPGITINNNREKADYAVVFDHEGGKGWARKDNKIAVFNHDGDSVMSKSTHTLGGSVEEACKAVMAEWESKGKARAAAAAATATPAAAVVNAAEKTPEPAKTKVQVTSEPAGADIEVDGAFVGNTPSTVELTAGDHTVAVKKDGFKAWEKKIKTTGGGINLSAELKKAE
jgi:hypothetical protein